jgi:hypothetical protein
MAAPWEYASSVYLDLKAKLDDGTLVTLKIDRYLNAALKLPRNKDAEKAKDSLLNHIAGELKVAYPGPLTFTIDSVTYNRLKLQRVFTGKGSPEDIRNVVRLASHFQLTDAEKVAGYCTKNIGLDCNGFAGNFWGIDPTTAIREYDVNRRQAVADVAAGNAMIFYLDGVAAPIHIAVVDEVNVIGKQFQVIVAQSMGLEQGLHRFDWGKLTPQNTKSGDLYARKTVSGVGDCTIYFAGGPQKGKSNM